MSDPKVTSRQPVNPAGLRDADLWCDCGRADIRECKPFAECRAKGRCGNWAGYWTYGLGVERRGAQS